MVTVSLSDVPSHTRLVLALQTARAVERKLVSVVEHGAAAVEQLSLKGQRID
jgi:hypothetical protein